MRPKVSVIIAVYNVADYIERCLHTLFRQTLDNIEYVFVDDASTDASVEIIHKVLQQYPHRQRYVKVIRHNHNEGVAAARTTGILAATGEYMIHCDPDDYVELNMYEQMYQEAKKDDADIVMCDYVIHSDADSRIINLRTEPDPQRLLTNMYKPLRAKGYLVIVMARASLIVENDILPFRGGDYAEDLGCTVRILYYGKSLRHISKPFYHYVKRKDSITEKPKQLMGWEKRKIVIDGICRTIGHDKRFKRTCDFIRLYTKLEYRDIFPDSKEWFDIYKESHSHIFRLNMPIKQKLLWIFLLTNYTFYRIGCKLYSMIN